MDESGEVHSAAAPFEKHVALLTLFLERRTVVVERIEALLNAQRRPAQYLQDGGRLTHHFEDCFFDPLQIPADAASLRGDLQNAHWAYGFRPRTMPGLHNDLVDPGQMMVRAFHLWQQTRWPGRNGRVRYAQTLFNLYLLRNLELLIMRLWDDGSAGVRGRLRRVQELLDALWHGGPSDQPVLVRDARWLIPLAQSPTTELLHPYFDVLEQISRSPATPDPLEIYKATVKMAGGHLRSQLRHHLMGHAVTLDDPSLIVSSRNSNALDFAMLVQGLVPLLEAYEDACLTGGAGRLELADAICQGVSADPVLFVNRVDLLGAYTMIEPLFIGQDPEGRTGYTPMGLRHVELVGNYARLLARVSVRLGADCAAFRPAQGSYSPYGLIYGFSSNLTEHVALKTLQSDAVTRFSLEDVFTSGDADKLAWVSGWRKLPHIDAAVQRLFDYPQQFAEDISGRIERAFHDRAAGAGSVSRRHGRLFIVAGDGAEDPSMAEVPRLPVHYFRSYDREFLHDRQEGTFAVSFETPDGWVAITKDFLTDVLGAGRDAKLTDLPARAAESLTLMCPGLVAGH